MMANFISVTVITCEQVNGESLISATRYQALGAIKLVVTCGQVNGTSLVSATHYQAVAAIKLAGNNMTIVVVKAAALPSDRTVCIFMFMY